MRSFLKISSPICLATASKARRKLISDLGIKFETATVDIDETPVKGEKVRAYVKRLAKAKAGAARSSAPDAIVVTVDTAIGIDGEIIGKPRNEKHARAILKKLSGRTHEVVSAIAIKDGGKIECAITSTKVEFIVLTKGILDWYISTREWEGRAGAYAIQGKGSALIKDVSGCFTNVIGISIPSLIGMLAKRM